VSEASSAESGAGTSARSEESSAVEVPRTPFWRRPAVRVALLGLGAGALAAGLVPIAVVYPYVRDDVRLDRVVRAVALDWRDFGEARARERLEYELDHQGVGPWVEDDDCAMTSSADGDRAVTCAWGVALPVWGTDRVVPLTFRSTATVDRSGDLR
jgi:hypothetical protein